MSEFRSRPDAPRPVLADDYDATDDVRAASWGDAIAAATPAALVAEAVPLAPEVAEGNLRRYARWQWRDYWERRGFWLAAAALFSVWVLVHWILGDHLQMRPDGHRQLVPVSPDAVLGISHLAFAVGGVLAGLLGAGGLVARERERGLQRFLFAKPVNIVRYYMQGFAVNGVGSLLVLAGAVLLAALTAPHALAVGTLLATAAAAYLLGAGATFFVSTLVRIDAPVAGAWLLAGFPVVALAENGYRWARVLEWLFPQGPALAVVKHFVNQSGGAATVQSLPPVILLVALVAAVWGAALTAAGVAVLRRRAIST